MDAFFGKAVEMLIHGNCYMVCWKYIFLVLSKRWLQGNIKYLKKRNYISQVVRWPCSFHFLYVTNEITHFVCLQSLFLQKLLSWMYLEFCEYFLWVWASEANSLAAFSKRVRRFEEKLNICCRKQELARTSSVCVNAWGKPNRCNISNA